MTKTWTARVDEVRHRLGPTAQGPRPPGRLSMHATCNPRLGYPKATDQTAFTIPLTFYSPVVVVALDLAFAPIDVRLGLTRPRRYVRDPGLGRRPPARARTWHGRKPHPPEGLDGGLGGWPGQHHQDRGAEHVDLDQDFHPSAVEQDLDHRVGDGGQTPAIASPPWVLRLDVVCVSTSLQRGVEESSPLREDAHTGPPSLRSQ
jgi:hypothetical protein